MVVLIQIEDYGFCKKNEGAKFVEERDLKFNGDFPISTDGGRLSGGQPGGAIGGFMPIVEAVTRLRGEAATSVVACVRHSSEAGHRSDGRRLNLPVSCGICTINICLRTRNQCAYIVTSAATARTVTDKPVYLLGFGEVSNYYHGSRTRPILRSPGLRNARHLKRFRNDLRRNASGVGYSTSYLNPGECGHRGLEWVEVKPLGTVSCCLLNAYRPLELEDSHGRSTG